MAIMPESKVTVRPGTASRIDTVFLQLPQDEIHSSKNKIGCSSTSTSSTSVQSSPVAETSKSKCKYYLKLSFFVLCIASLIFTTVIVCKDYLKILLSSMENINPWVAAIIFAILYTLVSLPMMWGYMILNVATGYLYGITVGTVLVIICALFGTFVAHELTTRFLVKYITAKILNGNERLQTVLRVVEEQGFKAVVLARLTPIPYGLQNGIFALSNIRLTTYMSATFLGCLPTQIVTCYIGTMITF